MVLVVRCLGWFICLEGVNIIISNLIIDRGRSIY